MSCTRGRVNPDWPHRARPGYQPGTLVWRNRWPVGGWVVECLEALAFPGTPGSAVLVRRVIALRGPSDVEVDLDLTAVRRQVPRLPFRRSGERIWEAHTDDLYVRWQVPETLAWHHNGGSLGLQLDAGGSADLVLELSDRAFDHPPVEAGEVLEATVTTCQSTVPDLADIAAPRDARYAFAVHRGLTAGTGAMVSAATASLPERANEGRDYDYRCAWIRDQCFAGVAGAAAPGAETLLDDAVRFVHERIRSDGPQPRPAYRTDGTSLPAQHPSALPGYPGAPKVLIGNHAGAQFQLDGFGEELELLAAAARADSMHGDAWRAAEVCADPIEGRWTEPDAGIWELTPQHYAQSRLACAAGLRQLAAVGPVGPRMTGWLALADAIVSEGASHCVHRSGRWQRTPEDSRNDAALLLAGLRGAVPADDPRTLATLESVSAELQVDGYVFRYAVDDEPLGQPEGAFLLCGFWLALAHHQAGHHREAPRLFERSRAACGPAGIFTEEHDVHRRQLRGNFPQAFVHALVLEAATTIAVGAGP